MSEIITENLMKVYLDINKINEICSRGIYWKEVSRRDEKGDIYWSEARETINSIGVYNVLAILNNYAEVEKERLGNELEEVKKQHDEEQKKAEEATFK